MADWYVSQTKWIALPQWQASHTYTVGQVVRPLTIFTTDNQCAYQCTAASGNSGSSEPSWNTNNNSTTTDGGVTWTNVTGQAATNWTTPAGSLGTLSANSAINSRIVGANRDRIFIDSTHAEINAINNTIESMDYVNAANGITLFSVNAAGSVPPVAADYLPGASISLVNGAAPDFGSFIKWNGISFSFDTHFTTSNNIAGITIIKDGVLTQRNTNAYFISWLFYNSCFILDNTSIVMASGASGEIFSGYVGGQLIWRNTPNAITNGGSLTNLINYNNTNLSSLYAEIDGVDLSGLGSSTVLYNSNNSALSTIRIINCELPPGITIYSDTGNRNTGGWVELINSDSNNTNYNSEFHSNQGSIITDTSTLLTGGATDGVTPFSHKVSTSTIIGGPDYPGNLETFTEAVYVANIGSSQTATIQIISSGTLTSADLQLNLEYLGNAGSCLGKGAATGGVLSAVNLSAGSGTWANPPGTPVQQQLTLTFTPQKKGFVRGKLIFTKASSVFWYNPVLNGIS